MLILYLKHIFVYYHSVLVLDFGRVCSLFKKTIVCCRVNANGHTHINLIHDNFGDEE